MKTNDFLDEPIEEVNVARKASEKKVPNKHPTRDPGDVRLALIGEAPGEAEVYHGVPFCDLRIPYNPYAGASGRLLSRLLRHCNIDRSSIFVGNVCQYRPEGNEISRFAFDGPEITEGIQQLAADLALFRPNVCLLLGRTALRAFNGQQSIDEWRGSPFVSTSFPVAGIKCIASYHPSFCNRVYDKTALLAFDIRKALRHATSPFYNPPLRRLEIRTSIVEILARLEEIRTTKPLITLDIEGYVGDLKCLSIATSPKEAFIVPFRTFYSSVYSPQDEARIWQALAAVMSDPAIPKVLQNSLYDRFVLQYTYDLIIHGVVDDTMLKQWEAFCELEKGLGFQASLHTDEPYYKSERKTDDLDTFWTYCCKDSALTYEVLGALDKYLTPETTLHEQFNVATLNPMLYMEQRGILYNTPQAVKRKQEVDEHIYGLQYTLDTIAGVGCERSLTRLELLQAVQSKICYKKDCWQPKAGSEDAFAEACARLQGEGPVSDATRGFVSIVTKKCLNIKSPMFKVYLYETLGLPPQYKIDPKTKKKALTADYEALLKLSKKHDAPALPVAIQIGLLRTRSQMLAITADPDGRMRCAYNVVGTETARITCYTSPTGSGSNLQTTPDSNSLLPPEHPLHKGMRDLFTADPDCDIFQCDLSGADGWTVAAYLAYLGDPTMLDDYRAGIKPAKVLCYLLRHGADSLRGRSRAEIKQLIKEVKSGSWDYFASKIGQHGTCYLMGARTLINKIYIESKGQVNLSEKDGKDLQRLFVIRYSIGRLHRWMAARLQAKPEITAASGHKRRMFGRYNEILGEALADIPQNNTTFATKLALYRLWTDPENQVFEDGPLYRWQQSHNMPTSKEPHYFRVEALHTVHDSLLGQCLKKDSEWTKRKLAEWFNNELDIMGQKIIIPFEGKIGRSWGEMEVFHE